jgi:hypothetical protein
VLPEIWVSLDLAGGFVAVDDGKLDVHENEIGPLGSGFRHTVPTVRRPGNVVVRSGEKVAQDAAQVFHDLTSSNSRAISMVITPGLRTS